MNPLHLHKRFVVVLALALLTLLVSACAPARIGVSWGALTEVEIYGQKGVLIAYNHYLSLLDPATGVAIALRDSEGRERIDEGGNRRLWVLDGHNYENAQFFTRPVKMTDAGVNTLLFAAYNDRLLKVTLDAARLDDVRGVPMGAPMISDVVEDEERLYVALKTGDVVAMNKTLLREDWRYDTPKGIWAAPLLHEGVLYAVSIDHSMHAIDAETGKAVWRTPLDLGGVAAATPLFHDGHLYVGSYAGKLLKVTLEGRIAGEYQVNNWIWSTPVFHEGLLYVTDLGGFVHAVDPATMKAVWSEKVAEKGIRPSPLVTDKYVVVASRDGRVYWLDRRDGVLVFTREVEGRPEILSELLLVKADPQRGLAEDMVVVSTVQMSHLVVAYALDNGRAAWVYAR